MVAILIMMNNYLHDVATALLISSGFAMWMIMKKYEESGKTHPLVDGYLVRIYDAMTNLAKISLIWIFLGGIPRVVGYRRFEWMEAAGRGQIPALIVKHIILGTMVGIGIWLWLRLSKKIDSIRKVAG